VSLQHRMWFNLVCLYMYTITELLVCCMGSEQKRYVEVTNQRDQLPISSNGSYMGFFLIGCFILFCLLLCAAVVDVERHARDFMETAKSLQLFFIKAQHQHKPTREEALRKVSPSFFFWFLEKHMIGSSMIVERRLVDLFFAADACCLDVLVKNHYLGVCLLKVLSSENCQL